MIRNKWKKIQIIVGLCIVITMLLESSVHAGNDESGSICIKLTDGEKGTEKSQVVFGYVKVADMIHGEFKGIEKYDAGMDWNQIDTAEEMERAAIKIEAQVKIPDGKVTTDEAGSARIDNLDVGMYLVYVVDAAKYETIVPFLVSIPTWENSSQKMNHQVNVFPKHEAVRKRRPMAPQTNLDSNYEELLGLAAAAILLAVSIWGVNNRKKTEK